MRCCIILAVIGAMFTTIIPLCADTKPVTVSNSSKNTIEITGSPTLLINDAVAGSELNSIIDNSSRFTIKTNQKGVSVVVSLNQNLPNHVRLYITIDLNNGQQTSGSASVISNILLSTSPQAAITNIDKINVNNAPIIFKLEASMEAGPVDLTNYQIIYTLQ